VHTLDALLRVGAASEVAASTWWPRFPFDHPLFVLFSSGTTGRPKCIVHGHGGTLLEHQKEHRLHSGLGPSDTLYFHTTAGWMMWNWLVSALACGTRIVLYDGSPTWPQPDSLLRMLQRESVTVFGTSAAYVQYMKEAGLEPARDVPLPRLRAIQSTGSVLYEWLFHWIHEHLAKVPVQSISGGTDILGCFVLGHPGLPVWAGESQCVSLAMDVRAAAGGVAQRTGTGELVCVNPFPSRPVGFLADPDGSRYRQTYYSQHEGAWTHGDFLTLYERGSARILGRSDGTLKIRGVRIGPAELYAVVMAMDGVVDAMALAQHAPDEPGGTRLVLLVVLAPGKVLDRPLTLRIKKELQTRASPVHVPAVIAQVQALPQTHNGKRSENAASDALHGRPVRNLVALKNPECLDEIRRLGGVQAP
jgi:acetoacetyl-CoA synthetase